MAPPDHSPGFFLVLYLLKIATFQQATRLALCFRVQSHFKNSRSVDFVLGQPGFVVSVPLNKLSFLESAIAPTTNRASSLISLSAERKFQASRWAACNVLPPTLLGRASADAPTCALRTDETFQPTQLRPNPELCCGHPRRRIGLSSQFKPIRPRSCRPSLHLYRHSLCIHIVYTFIHIYIYREREIPLCTSR